MVDTLTLVSNENEKKMKKVWQCGSSNSQLTGVEAAAAAGQRVAAEASTHSCWNHHQHH